MRVTDRILQQTFLYNLEKHKVDTQNIQEQISTRSKVNRPSDSPAGTSRILRLQNQLSGVTTFQKNIESAQSYLDATALSLEGITSEVQNVLVNLASINNASVNDLNSYASKIGMSIEAMLNFANSKFDEQYLFGGTNHSTDPFVKNGSTIDASSSELDGEQKIRIATNINQKINITGNELFFPSLKQTGNLDSSSAVGSVVSNTVKVLDPDGNEYDMNISYTKTAANTYTLDYDIVDAGMTSVTSGSNTLVFNANGALSTIDGNNEESIFIEDSATGIKLDLNIKGLTEKAASAQVFSNQVQKADIFKTLLSIKEGLENGIKPNSNQVKIVEEFSQHVINKTSEAGSIMNKLSSTGELLSNQSIELQELLGNERDVDLAEAIMDLNNTQFNLDMSYKISSMILPKSLMDFL